MDSTHMETHTYIHIYTQYLTVRKRKKQNEVEANEEMKRKKNIIQRNKECYL